MFAIFLHPINHAPHRSLIWCYNLALTRSSAPQKNVTSQTHPSACSPALHPKSLLCNFAAYAAALDGYTAAIIASDELGATGALMARFSYSL